MEKIRAALIGLGRVGSLLEDDALREKPCTHAGALASDEDCELVAGADLDGKRRELFSRRWGCPAYADPQEMLRIHKPQLLHIATHPDSHGLYCLLAARAGVLVAVCEKPLAPSLGEARKIASLERQGQLRIIVNHERRYAEDYREARRLIAAGSYGPLLGAKALLYMGKTRRLLDVLWHDGTHLVDAIMFLTGSSMAHSKRWGDPIEGREGTVFLGGALHGSGNPASFLLELGAGRDHLAFEIDLSFERGRLRIGNGIFEAWESGPCPYAEKFRSLRKARDGFAGETGYFANMVQDAVACVLDPSRQGESRAIDGLRAVEYLHIAGGRKRFQG